MKKLLIVTMLSTLLLGGASAFAETASTGKIAVVDVPQVVMNASKVKKLEADRIKQEKDLQAYILKAKKAVEAETDAEKIKALQQKYSKELAQKMEAQRKEVVNRTLAIEKDILTVINKKAKEMGYDMVIQKASVLYGGEDITEEISKAVN